MERVKTKLKQLREAADLSPAEVARAVGISRGGVYHWEDMTRPTMPSISNLLALSALYGVSVSEILGQKVGHSDGARVPLVTQHMLEQKGFLDDLKIPSGKAVFVPCPFDHGSLTFALEITSPANQASASNSIPVGYTAYFDPEKPAKNGDMVAAELPAGEVVVRQLVSEGGERFLRALNPEYRRISMPFRCVATMLGAVLSTADSSA